MSSEVDEAYLEDGSSDGAATDNGSSIESDGDKYTKARTTRSKQRPSIAAADTPSAAAIEDKEDKPAEKDGKDAEKTPTVVASCLQGILEDSSDDDLPADDTQIGSREQVLPPTPISRLH